MVLTNRPVRFRFCLVAPYFWSAYELPCFSMNLVCSLRPSMRKVSVAFFFASRGPFNQVFLPPLRGYALASRLSRGPNTLVAAALPLIVLADLERTSPQTEDARDHGVFFPNLGPLPYARELSFFAWRRFLFRSRSSPQFFVAEPLPGNILLALFLLTLRKSHYTPHPPTNST